MITVLVMLKVFGRRKRKILINKWHRLRLVLQSTDSERKIKMCECMVRFSVYEQLEPGTAEIKWKKMKSKTKTRLGVPTTKKKSMMKILIRFKLSFASVHVACANWSTDCLATWSVCLFASDPSKSHARKRLGNTSQRSVARTVGTKHAHAMSIVCRCMTGNSCSVDMESRVQRVGTVWSAQSWAKSWTRRTTFWLLFIDWTAILRGYLSNIHSSISVQKLRKWRCVGRQRRSGTTAQTTSVSLK